MNNLKSNNFIQTTLGELVSKEKKSIISGPFGSNIGKIFFKEKGIPVIRGNNLSTGGEKFKDDGFVFITREKADALNCYAIKNDLIFTAVGTIGQVGIIDEKLKYDEYVISNKQLRVRFDNDKITPLFAYYWFSSYWIQKLIVQRNVGSTVPLINLSVLKGLPITLPKSIDVQNGIVKVLENISAKIELNNRINAELEAMAKTLYDYWFVQFDFPNAKGKPYKTSGGKMVWNKELKREIPEGWNVVTVDDYAEVKKGELITAKDAKEGSVKVVAAGVDYSYLHSTPNRLMNTITISGSGANAGFINFWREPIFASDCITVRGKSDAETLILLQYLNFIQPHILSQATGSAQPHVYPSDIKVLNYVVPPDLLVESYGKITIPMNDKIGNNLIENQKITELRDWLLPMLMNGQVKVKDEKETELLIAAEPEMKYGK